LDVDLMLTVDGYSVIPILLLTTRLPSNLVPDFALTIHLLHLVTTTVWTRSLPLRVSWWALQALSAALMVLLGVWAVRYREVQRVVGFGKIGRNGAAAADRSSGANTRGDPGGGAQAYEMVEQGGRGDERV
jgi:protein SYS1